MYSFLFEHPLVEAITGWDFADGAWLGAPSGVIRKDNSVKPSYELLMNLTKKEWSTELTLKTDEAGYATVEGYRGLYELTADGAGAEFVLDKNGESAEVVL